ncbi:MAG: hypothetical protein WBW89_03465 [Candidatus Cybelea sp.]
MTHARYETVSVLRYIEDNFDLAPLAKAVARAGDPAAFDYTEKPRKFTPIAGSKTAYWMRVEKTSRVPRKPLSIMGDD